jgi:hypothetical protein
VKASSVPMAFALALCIGLPGMLSAQQSGWSMPNLNPFAARSSAPTSTRVADSGSGWKMPSMWPNSSATKKPAGPSVWKRMGNSTKRAWNQTVDFINPFDDANDNQRTTPITGSNTYFSHNANRKSTDKEKTSFFPAMWPSAEPEQKPSSVVEFLRQPRIDP